LERPEIKQFLLLIRSGAEVEDAAIYCELDADDLVELVGDVESARAELAVYAAGILRARMQESTPLARYFLDVQAGRHEVSRLHDITDEGEFE